MDNKEPKPDLDSASAFLREQYESVDRETKEKRPKEWMTWLMHYDMWIDLIGAALRDTKSNKPPSSIMVIRLMELQKHLLWLHTCALSGSYFSIFRELRYILESFLQAFFIDRQLPDSDLEQKAALLQQIENKIYGTTLIRKLVLKESKNIADLYSHLSKYVHSTTVEMIPSEREEAGTRVVFTFDGELFDRCMDFSNSVMDVVFLLSLYRFPGVVSKVKEDRITIGWMMGLDYRLSLKFLSSLESATKNEGNKQKNDA